MNWELNKNGVKMNKEKGISPLIAAVLLIGFTATVAAMLATWSQGLVKQQKQKFRQERIETEICQALDLRVESAVYDSSKNSITTLVWNTGDKNLTNFKIDVYYTKVNLTTKIPSNSKEKIPPGEFISLKVANVETPKKIEIRSRADECPKIQPLQTCTYSDGKLSC